MANLPATLLYFWGSAWPASTAGTLGLRITTTLALDLVLVECNEISSTVWLNVCGSEVGVWVPIWPPSWSAWIWQVGMSSGSLLNRLCLSRNVLHAHSLLSMCSLATTCWQEICEGYKVRWLEGKKTPLAWKCSYIGKGRLFCSKQAVRYVCYF